VFLGLVGFLAALALMSINDIRRNLRLLLTGVEPSMNMLRGLDPLQWAKRKIRPFHCSPVNAAPHQVLQSGNKQLETKIDIAACTVSR
jgi:hypothetical protein